MIDIYVMNCNIKTLNNLKKYKTYNVNYIDDSKLVKYKSEVNKNVTEDSNLYIDYLRFYIVYKNGGLLVDGNFKIVSDCFNKLLDDKMFLGYDNTNTISTQIIYSKNKKNELIRKILEEIVKSKDDKKNIIDILSIILDKDLSKKMNTSYISNDINIYSYDYFYPMDYEKNGKQFSENTKVIVYKNRKLGINQKTKYRVFKKYGPASAKYLSTIFSTIKFNFAREKYKKQLKFGIGIDKNIIKSRVTQALGKLDEYKDKEYIIIHNPCWLGVTSATKELFTNLLPLEELYDKDDIERLAEKICYINVHQVIFSAFNNGWDKLAKKIKQINSNIKIKVFWHGSNSQVIDEQNWNTNVLALNLQKEGVVDVFATCKESLLKFYEYHGYKTFFLKNTVVLDKDIKLKVENIKKENDDTIKIGMYSANMDWRKNMFNQLAAASLIKNSKIYSIPLNFDAEVFCSKVDQDITGTKKSVPREELLCQMAQNDINLYVTFSECAPMLPIESMEVGTLCITGDNHHYFKNTPLEKYLVVKREDDVIAITNKIKYALDNKDEIFRLYKEWKKNYDIESIESVKEFLKI